MKLLKFLPLLLSAMLCMGSADAQSFQGREDRILLAQFWKGGRSAQQDKAIERQPRQRRFVMPSSANTYQRREKPQHAGQPLPPEQAGRKPSRMTRDERRALRRQINEANQGIYKKKNNRASYPQP